MKLSGNPFLTTVSFENHCIFSPPLTSPATYFDNKIAHHPNKIVAAGEINVTEANVGQGDQAELAVYNIIEGMYSPDDLVNLTSVNSIFTFKV
jgi:hypothetical protein